MMATSASGSSSTLVRRADANDELAVRHPDREPVAPNRVEVRAASEHRHVVASAGELAAETAADSSSTDHDETHPLP